uniref:Uncharacterized protein n=1 Tax=Arundo donax TaxID=35708 RepID=A0A0A9F9T2_ARUDO
MCCPHLGLALSSSPYSCCMLQQILQVVILLLLPRAERAPEGRLTILHLFFPALS